MNRTRKPAVDAALSAHWQRAVSERRTFEIGLLIGQISATGAADALLTGIPVPSESGTSLCGFVDTSCSCVSLSVPMACLITCMCGNSTEDEDMRSFDDVSIDWVQEYAKQVSVVTQFHTHSDITKYGPLMIIHTD